MTRTKVLPRQCAALQAACGHIVGPSIETAFNSSLIGQCCPGDMECKEKPRDHNAARGNQRVMDARPSATHGISPEQRSGPNSQNRAENAEPCEGIEHKQQGIQRVVKNAEINEAHKEKNRGRNDNNRIDEQDQPYGEKFAPVAAVLAPTPFAPVTP